MLNQIDYNLIAMFEVLARTKSIKETATELSVTSSAISQALAKLETQIGTQLFLREHKKIKLSTAGLELYLKISGAIHNLQKELLDFNFNSHSKNPSGLISIGCPAEFGTTFMIKWFSDLQKSYPNIKMKLKLGSPPTLLSCLESGEVDFIVADDGPYYETRHQTLLIEKIFSEELVLCLSKQLYEKTNLLTSFKELIQLPHLDYSKDGSAIGIWYQHFYKKKPRKLELVMISENVRALINGVEHHLGLAMIPKYMVKKQLEKGTLIQISPQKNPLFNSLLLIQHQSKIPTVAEKIFLEMIRSKKGIIF